MADLRTLELEQVHPPEDPNEAVLMLLLSTIAIAEWIRDSPLAEMLPGLRARRDAVEDLDERIRVSHAILCVEALAGCKAALPERRHDVDAPELMIRVPGGARTCMVCGCTDDTPCPGGCAWVPPDVFTGDICTTCAREPS